VKQYLFTLLIVLTIFFFSDSLAAQKSEILTPFEKPSQDVKLLVDCGPGLHMCNCHKSGISPDSSNININHDNPSDLITHNFHYCELEGNDCDCSKVK